ncbi:MAG: aldose 1-epimerase family protein [Cyclobacteriaceae bacterium]
MVILLKNGILTASVALKGAELTSLIKSETEYIWQADATYWGRHTPVLFPIVGQLKNNSYFFEGKEYAMKQHGFARDQEFKVEKQSDESVTLLLRSSEVTKENYPFDFELRVTHSLNKNRLATRYEVTNTQTSEILFSIGGHPAYNCPLEKGHKRNEYAIRLDDAHEVKSKLLDNGTIGSNEKKVLENGNTLPLFDDAIFDQDAIIFDPNPFRKATVLHTSTKKEYLSLHFQGFPSLGIWSKNSSSPFVCIEPWYGISDYHNHDQQLINKKGIISLEAGKVFDCQYAVEVF